jgi:hypothetical protein
MFVTTSALHLPPYVKFETKLRKLYLTIEQYFGDTIAASYKTEEVEMLKYTPTEISFTDLSTRRIVLEEFGINYVEPSSSVIGLLLKAA